MGLLCSTATSQGVQTHEKLMQGGQCELVVSWPDDRKGVFKSQWVPVAHCRLS